MFYTFKGQLSKIMNTDRNVTIQITNYSNNYTLDNPRIYTYSGHCYDPPQPTIKQNPKEVCSFTKTASTATGSVGVMTYQILTNDRRCIGELAIMFSVPYDYNLYENVFALGIFKKNTECDETLYNMMYSNVCAEFRREKGIGSSMTHTGGNILLKGTMSPQAQSVMKVELWDKQC
uniref:Uncharacterized protein n=1 Tax=Astyanax mexicanus TaxID=7994 RepID=W5KPN9_ASTMX